jgi:hypothetical protein
MTEMIKILNSVHKSNDLMQRRRVPLSVVSSIESECSELGAMTEKTLILNSVHTSNDSM